jgi:peptidoglycan/LPS O-acetylase OafA/YrhL
MPEFIGAAARSRSPSGGTVNPNATAYRPDIDGLRAVAVIAVVLHHLLPKSLTGGYVGVDVFFVISGFLITRIIANEIRSGTFSYADFYERRARRILPALFAVVVAVLVAGWFVLLPTDYLGTLRAAIGSVLFSANLVFWRQLREGYFANDAKDNPLLHMWSLGVEEQFYLFFPVFLILGLKLFEKRFAAVLLLLAAASLALSEALVDSKTVAVFFLLPFRAWELAVGCLLALSEPRAPRSAAGAQAMAVAGLLAIVVPAFTLTPDSRFPGLLALAPVLGAAMLIRQGASQATLVHRLLSARAVVLVGLASYSLYLWHWPIIVFARHLLGLRDLGVWAVPVLLLSLGAAWLSYIWVERPFRSRSTFAWSRAAIFRGCAAIAAAIVVVGAVGLHRRGWESRWPETALRVDAVRTALVPFRKSCEGVLCTIGDTSKPPDVLLWGDSHMLAWLPGFDRALKASHRSAVVAMHSACPPIFGVSNIRRTGCISNNNRAAELIRTLRPKKLILAARWEGYFHGGRDVYEYQHGDNGGRHNILGAFSLTLRTLSDANVETLLLGPVPTYEFDVPMTVARRVSADGGALSSEAALASVHARNAAFYSATNAATTSLGKNIHVVDVASWMCAPTCLIYEGEVLYRDSNHLSAFGAARDASRLAELLGAPSEAGRGEMRDDGRNADGSPP